MFDIPKCTSMVQMMVCIETTFIKKGSLVVDCVVECEEKVVVIMMFLTKNE